MQALGWLAMGTAMILVVLHRTAAKRYLDAYEARTAAATLAQGGSCRRTRSARSRRCGVAGSWLVVPASILVMTGITLIVFAT